RAWQPRLVVLLERELWPNFLHQAQGSGVPVVVANARLSERSAASYRRWHALMGPALASLRLVCCEDSATAARFVALGVSEQRVPVTGNIKSDVRIDAALRGAIAQTRVALGSRTVLTAGSTHAGEDEALIDAFQQHLTALPETLLILVPRHPERFPVVAELLRAAGLRFVRASQGELADSSVQVLLGDTMGQLLRWYGVADACFVGGSLVARGGHNPLEVLALDKPLVVGRHTHNFAQMVAGLRAAGAVHEVDDANGVFDCLAQWVQHPDLAARQVAQGRQAFQAMTGALARTLALLETFAREPGGHTAPVQTQRGRDTIWVDPRCRLQPQAALFDPLWWQAHGASQAHGAGRGRVYRVHDASGVYLLRHYYRGGLMARLIRDRFLAKPLAETRAMAEFHLLAQLRARGLPVPRPCAALHTRCGLFYRADILVGLIPGARDVADQLHHAGPVTAAQWQALGRAVRRLHDAQVFHSDLNCHNLMLDTDGVAWIVDFDKCGFRVGDDWKADNLARLLRSLRKELRLNPALHWRESDWKVFIGGYEAAPQPAL
ncbi:MAG: 3-deoxy-D-manno-octulosonic acid kinase, partial [Burkholderiaceae bacterium]